MSNKYSDFDLDSQKVNGYEGNSTRSLSTMADCTLISQLVTMFCGQTDFDCIDPTGSACPEYTETCSQCRSYCGGACRR